MASRAELVASLAYKPGWAFKCAGPGSRYLCVFATTPNSWPPHAPRCTQHQFEIPDELLDDRREFARWAFARLLDVEHHECAEFFQIGGQRPFYPGHNGADPYEHREAWT